MGSYCNLWYDKKNITINKFKVSSKLIEDIGKLSIKQIIYCPLFFFLSHIRELIEVKNPFEH